MIKNPLDSLAVKLAGFIKSNYENSSSIEKLTYSSIILLNTLFSVIVSMLVCMATGNLLRFVIVFVVLTIVRYFTGGAHMRSSLSCALFTTVALIAVVHIDYDYHVYGYIADAISLMIFAVRAPSGIDVIRKVSPQKKYGIKIISLLVIATNFYFNFSLLSSIILLQAVSMTHSFERLLHIIEGKGITHD